MSTGLAGGGSGGESRCTFDALGDEAEVWAVYQAVNAEQAPAPVDTSYSADIIQNRPAGSARVEASWYRIDGDEVQILYAIECVDPPRSYSEFLAVRPNGAGGFALQVSAADLLPALRDRVMRQLPTPVPRIGPADENAPNHWTYVNNRTFFWVDQVAGQWDSVSATASAGGISVTVTAVPTQLVVDPGDGSEPTTCDGAPPAVTRSSYQQTADRGCAYTYRDSSAMAPNGESFPVTVTILWQATWSASTGEGGDLGALSTTSATRDLQVAEMQAIIVPSDPVG